jgi:hypothetical protein
LKKFGIETVPAIATRAVILDMVGLTGKKPVPEGTAFNQPEIEAALERQGNMKIEKGDVVIFYTGWHTLLGVDDKRNGSVEPGLGVQGAKYLASLGVAMIGSDTWALEVIPFENAGQVFHVHQILLAENGIFILENVVAADVLNYLPPETRSEVIQRVASLETVQPSAMEELEAILKKQFSNNSSSKSSSFGGIKAAANILNLTKTALEASVMGGLKTLDPELMQKIQDSMFTFDNLVSVDNKGIQVIMRNAEPDLMMKALKGASDEVKKKFLDNMSERARGMFKDDMEALGPMRLSDVEDAQKIIMRAARKLADAGDLVLGGGADYV